MCPTLVLYLHGHWEVILSLWREENINSFLLEWRVSSWRSSNLNNVELAPGSTSHSKAEESALLLVSFHLELDEGSSVALNRLGHLPLHTVELHGPHHPVLLGRDPDQEEPVLGCVCSVVYDLKREM